MRGEDDSDLKTLWCGNISDEVTDEVLYELFLQAGPLEGIRRPRDPNGRPKSFAFIVYKYECSVPYAIELFRGEKLFKRPLNLSARTQMRHIPVLDTHVTEFTKELESKARPRKEMRDHQSDRRRSGRERKNKEPSSWAEVNALRGSLINGQSSSKRDDLLGGPMYTKESKSQNTPACMPDFNTLLQMGQQMMPGMMIPGIFPFPGSPLPGMGPVLGHSMYPSMQGEMSGGERNSRERDRRSSDYHEGRENRRDHPYRDDRQGYNRRFSDSYYDQRHHDRGYSSSRSSHERERRDRRSR